jgi:hypothetical protein
MRLHIMHAMLRSCTFETAFTAVCCDVMAVDVSERSKACVSLLQLQLQQQRHCSTEQIVLLALTRYLTQCQLAVAHTHTLMLCFTFCRYTLLRYTLWRYFLWRYTGRPTAQTQDL